MRFASHRDVARAIERGVRKAGIPVAYSAGFSPHPRISYAGGAPTGTASEAEYLDISLTRRCEPAELGRRLSAALPDGIDVIEVVEAPGSGISSAARFGASGWEVIWPGVSPASACVAARDFLAARSVVVERLTSKGMRQMDARAAVVSLRVDEPDAPRSERRGETDPAAACAILRVIVRQMTPAVRPDDVLTALRQVAAASGSALTPSAPALVTRVWQGPLAADPGDDPRNPRETDLASEQTTVSGSAPVISTRSLPQALTYQPARLATGVAPLARANEQLPRGEPGQLAGPRAREPQERDCPNARDRATEHPVRT